MARKFAESKDYYEQYAKEILVQIGLFNRDDIEVKDKPDLWITSKNIGIEVVRDIFSNEEEATNFIIHEIIEKNRTLTEQEQHKMYKLGVESFNNRNYNFAWTPNNMTHIKSTIDKKINVLNKADFRIFEKNGLYIYVDTLILSEQRIIKLMDYTSRKDIKYNFDTFYLDGIHELWVCDLKRKSIQYFNIDKTN